MAKLVTAYDTRTGKQRQVPENWFDHEELAANLSRTKPDFEPQAPAGRNQVTNPDDRDFPPAVPAPSPEDLKGAALDEALEAAGLPKSGTADEKRARLAEHLAEHLADQDDVDEDDPIDSNTGDNNQTPPAGEE